MGIAQLQHPAASSGSASNRRRLLMQPVGGNSAWGCCLFARTCSAGLSPRSPPGGGICSRHASPPPVGWSGTVDRACTLGVIVPLWGSDLPMRRQLKNRARPFSGAQRVVIKQHLFGKALASLPPRYTRGRAPASCRTIPDRLLLQLEGVFGQPSGRYFLPRLSNGT